MACAGLAQAAACGGHDLIGKSGMTCLAQDVRSVDARMDKLYHALLDKSPAQAKSRVEASQQAFIDERDSACRIDSRAISRAQWFAKMQTSYNGVLCEMRYTHARTGQLRKLLAALGQASQQQALGAARLKFRLVNEDYQLISPDMHRHGRWYLEIKVNGAALADLHGADSAAFRMACGNPLEHKGKAWLAYTTSHASHGPAVYRLALDLERGRIYFGHGGKWLNGTPRVSGSDALYRKGMGSTCSVITTERIADLLASGALDVNFGQHPFAYAPPKSFKPFLARPRWIVAKGAGMTTSVDYSATDLEGAQPSILVRNRFDKPQTSQEGYRYRTAFGQFDVNCRSMSFRQVLDGVAADADGGYAVSIGMKPGKPVTVASLGGNSFMGNAARTICFLKKNGFAWPRLDSKGKWESMKSPVAGVHIYEAPDQRQYRNGYILAKVKNTFSSDVSRFGGKAGTSHIGYMAVACKKHRANALFVAGFDAQGHLAGGAFYSADGAMPKLPENRKRYEDACRAYLSNPMAYEHRGALQVATAKVHIAHPPAHRRAVAHKRAKPVRHARRARPHARKTPRYASRDKDLRYCLDQPTNEAIIACTEKGDRGAR